VQLTSSPRRALGLVAVGAIGISTAVLGVTGTARAADDLQPIDVSTYDGDTGLTVPKGYCTVEWELQGADGGRGRLFGDTIVDPATGAGFLAVTTSVTAGQKFTFTEGGAGSDGDNQTGGGAGGAGAPAGADGTDITAIGILFGGGGGGGGAAAVTGPSVSLVSHGGAGADAANGGAGGGGAANAVTWPGAVVTKNETLGFGYSSYVSARVLPCIAAPLAPTGVVVAGGNGSLDVSFTPTWNDAPNSSQPETWEYRLGNGAWTAVQTSAVEYSAERTFTLTGLGNGKSYGVQVRGVSEDGRRGDASSTVTGVPFAAIGAPGDVTVSTTSTSITVTWTKPTVAGTFPVGGYGVGLGAGEMGGEACTTGADVLTCTLTDVQPGMDYSVVVYAYDTKGNSGTGSPFVMTGALPFPASVPATDGELATSGFSTGSVAAGETITVSGSGYMPFSTVTVLVYSTPTVLGTVEADENGTFTFTGALPEGLEAGEHTLVASGVDPSGEPRNLTMSVTVGGDTAALANTGFSAAPVLGAGALALLAGGGLILSARRRVA
jgi:hypothetical protein